MRMSQFHDKKERTFMRKLTKLVTFIMVFALLLAPAVHVMAGSINEHEQGLLEFGNSVFTYNGVEYVATDAAKQRVYNYLMQNDVNLSASQANEARSEFYANIATGIADGYLVPLNPPAEEGAGGSGDTSTVAPEVTYTYTELTATMYAIQAVNVRNQPSVNGARIGSLTTNQAVEVTGQCAETGWYRIIYNGIEAYVSNNYLSDTKVVTETETTEETEVETETELVTGTESETEMSTELVTELSNESGESTETEVPTEATETVEETEKAEVTLKNKEFNKGLDVTTVAIVIGAVVLAGAVIVVASHKNRRYRK